MIVDKEILYKMIWIENLPYLEIAKNIGCKSVNAVKKKAIKFGLDIPKRISYNGHNKSVIKYTCQECGVELLGNKKYKAKFCSHTCQNINQYKKFIDNWKNGLEDGVTGKIEVSAHIRKYIFKKYNNKCCKCGWCEVNKLSNKIPLQVNHIDGNCLNNKEENL